MTSRWTWIPTRRPASGPGTHTSPGAGSHHQQGSERHQEEQKRREEKKKRPQVQWWSSSLERQRDIGDGVAVPTPGKYQSFFRFDWNWLLEQKDLEVSVWCQAAACTFTNKGKEVSCFLFSVLFWNWKPERKSTLGPWRLVFQLCQWHCMYCIWHWGHMPEELWPVHSSENPNACRWRRGLELEQRDWLRAEGSRPQRGVGWSEGWMRSRSGVVWVKEGLGLRQKCLYLGRDPGALRSKMDTWGGFPRAWMGGLGAGWRWGWRFYYKRVG